MIKKYIIIGLCLFLLGVNTIVYAADTDVILEDSTTSSGFSVKDASNNTILRASGDGNVGIGTPSPSSRLHIEDSTNVPLSPTLSSNAAFKISDDNSQQAILFDSNQIESVGNNLFLNFRNTDGTGKDVIITSSSGGNVGIGINNPGCKLDVGGQVCSNGTALTSDIRFKKNVQQLNSALKKVQNLRGVSFEWRTDEYKDRNFSDDRNIGVIAQEVEKVVPEVVHTNQNGYKSVEYSKLVPFCIEAIKEQQETISALSAKVKVLEGKINMEN